ncbi:MAG: RNA polymerase sigma factor [Akkermansiaceae bacterium]
MDESPFISQTLLSAVREGQDDAWRELIDLLTPHVYKIIRSQVRSQADHDDLAQEAFTKIFLKLDQYNAEKPLAHWTARITINTCYDWLRRKKARPLVNYADLGETQADILEKTLGDESSAPKQSLSAMRELLDQLIASLKPREQIIIRLLDLEEKSVQDICDLTGWGASKVKVTAMRARRKLAVHLQQLESNSPNKS